MNTAGEPVLGEPLVSKDEGRREQKYDKKGERESRFDVDFLASFKDMSRGERIRKLAIGAGLVIIICAIYLFATMPTTDPLLERGKFIAKAFLDKADDRIRAVAQGDTGEDAVLWMQKGRAQLGIKGSSGDFMLNVEILEGGKSQGGAVLMANVEPRSPDAVGPPEASTTKKGQKAQPAGPVGGLLMFPMNLVIGPERQWLLDGRQSLSRITAKH
ncbi:MAG TPA: hypothetical protein VGY53_07035 [Isosphaeraceae bacterium]|nr:hypothetical protein [Isosphaeraceae bacterium]